ncbi:hypothetical protein [Oceanithermus sp.]
MKKLMALVLSVGLVLLGTAPVMAAGQSVSGPKTLTPPVMTNIAKPLPKNLCEITDLCQIKIPEPPGMEALSDGELEEVEGEGLIGAVIGAAVGFVSGAIVGGVTAAVASRMTKGHVDWNDVKVGAVAAGAGMAVRGAIRGAIVGP